MCQVPGMLTTLVILKTRDANKTNVSVPGMLITLILNATRLASMLTDMLTIKVNKQIASKKWSRNRQYHNALETPMSDTNHKNPQIKKWPPQFIKNTSALINYWWKHNCFYSCSVKAHNFYTILGARDLMPYFSCEISLLNTASLTRYGQKLQMWT